MFLKCQLIKTIWMISEDNQFMSKHIFFAEKILQHTCFALTCYTCSYFKKVLYKSQYHKPSDFQYARF